MLYLINPPYSFVEFRPGSRPAFLVTEFGDFILTEDDEFIVTEDSYLTDEDTEACDYPLPMILDSDLKFQTFIQTAGVVESAHFVETDQKLFVVKETAVVTNDTELAANTLLSMPDNFICKQIADNKVLLCWPFGLSGVSSLAEKTCFRLCLRAEVDGTVQYFISNCFIKSSDTKYTSVITYNSDENNFGFDYCNDCHSNRVRIHIYLGSPQIKEEQSVYVKSTGKRKLLKYSSAELFEIATEHFNETLHKKISIALAHDFVYVTSSRYTGGIRKDGDYTIDWDRLIDTKAPATAKAYAEDYAVKNNNCNECVEYIPPVICGVITDINPGCEDLLYGETFTMPDAVLGVPYSYSITLTGTTPFELSIVSKPSWMTIAVDGSSINFSGTPDSAGTVDVSFNVTNCGEAAAAFSDSIDVAIPPTHFEPRTFVGGDDSYIEETGNILGTPASDVTVKVTTYVNINSGGEILVDTNPVVLNDEFTVTLGSDGKGTFNVRINGDPDDTGTAVLCIFTITAVTAGTIGSPSTYQVSKVF